MNKSTVLTSDEIWSLIKEIQIKKRLTRIQSEIYTLC